MALTEASWVPGFPKSAKEHITTNSIIQSVNFPSLSDYHRGILAIYLAGHGQSIQDNAFALMYQHARAFASGQLHDIAPLARQTFEINKRLEEEGLTKKVKLFTPTDVWVKKLTDAKVAPDALTLARDMPHVLRYPFEHAEDRIGRIREIQKRIHGLPVFDILLYPETVWLFTDNERDDMEEFGGALFMPTKHMVTSTAHIIEDEPIVDAEISIPVVAAKPNRRRSHRNIPIPHPIIDTVASFDLV